MKIKIIINEDSDGYESQEMEIDGKHSLSVFALCECPEDAIIGRNLVSCTEIVEYMKLAYEAGKKNEELIIEEIKGG